MTNSVKIIPVVLVAFSTMILGCADIEWSRHVHLVPLGLCETGDWAMDSDKIWNMPYQIERRPHDEQGNSLSGKVCFNGRTIWVREDRNLLVFADEQGDFMSHPGGWSRLLQCVAVVRHADRELLVVVKGYRTYYNYSLIHVFDADFNCIWEGEVYGRGLRVTKIEEEASNVVVYLEYFCPCSNLSDYSKVVIEAEAFENGHDSGCLRLPCSTNGK